MHITRKTDEFINLFSGDNSFCAMLDTPAALTPIRSLFAFDLLFSITWLLSKILRFTGEHERKHRF